METKQGRVVMLLDDNEIDNFIHKSFLESRGISSNVLVMGTAKKALNYLISKKDNQQEIPDILLLDINLPAISGYGFLEEFKKLPESVIQKCKIVVLSSSEKDEDLNDMKKEPLVKKYYIKPLSEKAMKEIRELLN